eukprot:scaffold9483_cov111-Skeletonema_dohrnii-CCMP3373.AAC.3
MEEWGYLGLGGVREARAPDVVSSSARYGAFTMHLLIPVNFISGEANRTKMPAAADIFDLYPPRAQLSLKFLYPRGCTARAIRRVIMDYG